MPRRPKTSHGGDRHGGIHRPGRAGEEDVMYKKILVPLDGSKRAERILPYVEKLAHDNDATVIFLTVVSAPRVFGYDDLQYAHFEKQFETFMEESENYLKGVAGGIQGQGHRNAPPCRDRPCGQGDPRCRRARKRRSGGDLQSWSGRALPIVLWQHRFRYSESRGPSLAHYSSPERQLS